MTPRMVSISRMGHRGDGVAGELFVARALPGETVEVEGEGTHPTLARVIEPSPERTAPFCRHFGACGGCAIQHWALEPYLAWKRQLVIDALAQAGLETTVHETVDAHGSGRRRALFHAGRQKGELRVGFMAARSHAIVPIEACPILSPEMAGALPAARALAGKLAHLGKPLDIVVTATIDGLDVDLRGIGRLAESDARGLISAAGALGLARLSNHGALVFQKAPPRVEIGGILVGLPPGGFLQATAAGEKALAKLVLAAIDAKARRVADLFCGVGPFALGLARRARVFAADQDARAIVALLAAARTTPGLKPVEAEARDLFRRPLGPSELKGFDAVIFDPARAGAEAQAHAIARSSVPRVVAVSCNPATLARDAKILTAGGFRLFEATPIDQFRHSAHVEIVAVLAR